MSFRLSSHVLILFSDYWKFVRGLSKLRQQSWGSFRHGKACKDPGYYHQNHHFYQSPNKSL